MPILIVVIAFGIMIFIHELGHFIAAKSFGVLVHEFSMGMGPKLFSLKKGETMYSLRLFPIGGFVKLEGELESNDENDPRSFINLHPFKRIIVLFAGAFMNLLLGFIIFIIINMNTGIIPAKVNEVPQEFIQQGSVFESGDEILKLNGKRMHTYQDISFFISRYDNDTIDIKLKRDGKFVELKNIKLFKTDAGYKLGITFGNEKADFFKSSEFALYDTVFTVKSVYYALGDLFTGNLPVSSLSGPVEIVAVVGKETKDMPTNKYTFLWVLSLVAMISVNLGVFNLLPFPALDGGSIIFALYELITKRKINSKIFGYITAAGFVILMLLAIYVTADDIFALLKN